MSYLYPTLGLAIAVAGLDKIVGQRGYERMFGHLDWNSGRDARRRRRRSGGRPHDGAATDAGHRRTARGGSLRRDLVERVAPPRPEARRASRPRAASGRSGGCCIGVGRSWTWRQRTARRLRPGLAKAGVDAGVRHPCGQIREDDRTRQPVASFRIDRRARVWSSLTSRSERGIFNQPSGDERIRLPFRDETP